MFYEHLLLFLVIMTVLTKISQIMVVCIKRHTRFCDIQQLSQTYAQDEKNYNRLHIIYFQAEDNLPPKISTVFSMAQLLSYYSEIIKKPSAVYLNKVKAFLSVFIYISVFINKSVLYVECICAVAVIVKSIVFFSVT